MDATKVAALVRAQGQAPKLPPRKAAGKPMPGAAKPHAPGTQTGAPAVGPPPNIEELTPQEISALVEAAAQAAEAQQDPALEDQLVDYMHGDTTQPPAWATDAELWKKAMDAVEPTADRYEEPYAVTAYLYKKLGGALHEASAEASEQENESPPGHAPPEAGKEVHPGGNPALKEPPVHGRAGEGSIDEETQKKVAAAASQATTNPDPQLKEKLAGYDPARDGNPPAWAADPDIWAKAEEAVKPQWDSYDEPYAVVAHVYKSMGGTVT